MSQRARDDYFHACGRHGIPASVAASVLRHAHTVQRAAEVACSVSDEKTRTYWQHRDEAAVKSIKATFFGTKWGVVFDDEPPAPKGPVVTLVLFDAPSPVNIAVPSVGFTGQQIDRLCRVS